MSLLSTTLLAFSMSADAFAVSVGKGAVVKNPRLTDAIKNGAVFGGTEALMPILGWLAGLAAAGFIQSVDHWLAFAILAGVGLKMIAEAIWEEDEPHEQKPEENKRKTKKNRFRLLVITAVGTSLDSMAVGVSLAFIDANIWLTALAIGLASFSMSTLGLMIGHYIGARAGRYAEILGGLTLIAIGGNILRLHLS